MCIRDRLTAELFPCFRIFMSMDTSSIFFPHSSIMCLVNLFLFFIIKMQIPAGVRYQKTSAFFQYTQPLLVSLLWICLLYTSRCV